MALSVALLVAVVPRTESMRIRTPVDRKRSEEVWTKAAATETTSYGEPQVAVLNKTMSVDHFSSVRCFSKFVILNISCGVSATGVDAFYRRSIHKAIHSSCDT